MSRILCKGRTGKFTLGARVDMAIPMTSCRLDSSTIICGSGDMAIRRQTNGLLATMAMLQFVGVNSS